MWRNAQTKQTDNKHGNRLNGLQFVNVANKQPINSHFVSLKNFLKATVRSIQKSFKNSDALTRKGEETAGNSKADVILVNHRREFMFNSVLPPLSNNE